MLMLLLPLTRELVCVCFDCRHNRPCVRVRISPCAWNHIPCAWSQIPCNRTDVLFHTRAISQYSHQSNRATMMIYFKSQETLSSTYGLGGGRWEGRWGGVAEPLSEWSGAPRPPPGTNSRGRRASPLAATREASFRLISRFIIDALVLGLLQ